MMKRFKLNDRYGMLSIIGDSFVKKLISRNGIKYGKSHVLVKCDCGTEKVMLVRTIANGAKSCGCHKNKKHGLHLHPIYLVYKSIKCRCYNKRHPSYKYYGERGVKMCKEWLTDFTLFFEWCLKNGWERGLEVDRFPRKNGNYGPNNCRIVTKKVNQRNTRNNVMIKYNGQVKCISEWAELLDVPRSRLRYRIFINGMTPKKAFTMPIRKNQHQ